VTGAGGAGTPAAPASAEVLPVVIETEALPAESIDRAPDLTSRLSTYPSRLIVVAALDGNLGQYPSKSRELAGAVRKHLGHGALIGITAHVNPKVALQDRVYRA
jgi:hypothetical protein